MRQQVYNTIDTDENTKTSPFVSALTDTRRTGRGVCSVLENQLTINYYQRERGTKRMVDMSFEFDDLCTTIPPVEYGGSEVLLDDFAAVVGQELVLCPIS